MQKIGIRQMIQCGCLTMSVSASVLTRKLPMRFSALKQLCALLVLWKQLVSDFDCFIPKCKLQNEVYTFLISNLYCTVCASSVLHFMRALFELKCSSQLVIHYLQYQKHLNHCQICYILEQDTWSLEDTSHKHSLSCSHKHSLHSHHFMTLTSRPFKNDD